ncbi:hypothetical protein [Paraglaciecola hydrolytica]|uniref:Uncharacterized protein n=1 Tax=Paraglaciecola hydrolytica TaxID=1799789 RepID=A0A136A2S6_9ALTE|nr:hypothetical protein [Paraglaciecola hydrolytica]KXI29535.1 hypothetical protein AX660_05610 [Paraglaciecola hydrolytica]
MFIKSKIAAVALVSSLVFAAGVQAKEMSVEDYVTTLVTQAVQVASQEVQYSVQAAVLTATNSLSFNEEKTYIAKVTITDIKVIEADKNEAE